MKKILIVPGNLFVSRNYFSSPLLENLKRISIKDNINVDTVDLNLAKTYAKKEGSHYLINGVKNWVTSGINSDYVILFAVTTQGIGHKGISCFIHIAWHSFH